MTTTDEFEAPQDLTIIGFGLIGGAIALAARRAFPRLRITGVDTAQGVAEPRAVEVADSLVRTDDPESLRVALARSDLAVLATPVDVIELMLPRVLEFAECVTDCGSTKRTICDVARATPYRDRFVPGHPMSGDPAGGIDRARADLFDDRPWILCPADSSPHVVRRVRSFVVALGARPMETDADWHDRAVAVTSHVPQVVASALAVRADRAHASAASGPGFASATRVAGGGDAMWRAIFRANADHVSEELRALCRALEDTASGLEQDPPDLGRALSLLAEARRLRQPK